MQSLRANGTSLTSFDNWNNLHVPAILSMEAYLNDPSGYPLSGLLAPTNTFLSLLHSARVLMSVKKQLPLAGRLRT